MIADLLGMAGYVALVSGAWLEWGAGVALIVGGAPLVVGYVSREIRLARNGRG